MRALAVPSLSVCLALAVALGCGRRSNRFTLDASRPAADAGGPDAGPLRDGAAPPRRDAGGDPPDDDDAGAPLLPMCGPITRVCGESCVDPRYNPAHCGECEHACSATEACEDGRCVARACAEQTIACGDACVDPGRDREHCGAAPECDPLRGSAGAVCGHAQACHQGRCQACPMLAAPSRPILEGLDSARPCTSAHLAQLDADPSLEILYNGNRAIVVDADASGALVVRSLDQGIVGGAIRDVDGDGISDLSLRSLGDAVLQRGLGDGTFEPARTYAAGAAAYWFHFALLGDDAEPDIVALTASAGVSVTLYTAGVAEPATPLYALHESSTSHVIADIDGDGYADVVVGQPEANELAVLLGRADQSLSEASYVALEPPAQAYPQLAGDLNDDGFADVLLGGAAAHLLLANGAGGFTAARAIPELDSAASVQLRHLDADGRIDVVAAFVDDNYLTGLSLLRGGGDGTFELAGQYSPAVAHPVGGFDVGDIDGDGLADIVACADAQYHETFGYAPLHVFHGRAPFDIDAPRRYPGGFVPIYGGELDPERGLELVGEVSGAIVVRDPGPRALAAGEPGHVVLELGGARRASAVHDVNGDGRRDVVVLEEQDAPAQASLLRVALARAAGEFTPREAQVLPAATHTFALGDFDADGTVDLALASDARLGFWRGDGDGGFAEVTAAALALAARSLVAVAAIDGDGEELIAALAGGDVVRVRFGADGSELRERITDAGEWVALSDLEADGFPDLVLQQPGSSGITVNVLRGASDGTFYRARADAGVAKSGWIGLLADLDRDGFADLIRASSRENLQVWPGDGRGGFHSAFASLPWLGQPQFVGDLDGDGLPDLVLQAGRDVILLAGRSGPGCP